MLNLNVITGITSLNNRLPSDVTAETYRWHCTTHRTMLQWSFSIHLHILTTCSYLCIVYDWNSCRSVVMLHFGAMVWHLFHKRERKKTRENRNSVEKPHLQQHADYKQINMFSCHHSNKQQHRLTNLPAGSFACSLWARTNQTKFNSTHCHKWVCSNYLCFVQFFILDIFKNQSEQFFIWQKYFIHRIQHNRLKIPNIKLNIWIYYYGRYW